MIQPTMKKSLLALFLLAPVLVHADAREVDGHHYPLIVQAAPNPWKLQGAGKYVHLGIWSVYSSALYLQRPADAGDILGDVPKRLEITYYRRVSAGDLVEIGDKYLARNLTGPQLELLKEGVQAINKLYRDVDSGDRYTLEYLPGSGTTLSLNGKALGTVPGKEFGSLYFAIWLGPKSPDDDLRDELLGR